MGNCLEYEMTNSRSGSSECCRILKKNARRRQYNHSQQRGWVTWLLSINSVEII